jgi:hypothetical protein
MQFLWKGPGSRKGNEKEGDLFMLGPAAEDGKCGEQPRTSQEGPLLKPKSFNRGEKENIKLLLKKIHLSKFSLNKLQNERLTVLLSWTCKET